MRYLWVPESLVKISIVVYVAVTLASRLSTLINHAGLASVMK